ncbi:MAG: elongation factor Ts [Candidatus Omnitrophica bacterium]|nr:elongation factor Ts [Candidatus Omnitrophota bacterium]
MTINLELIKKVRQLTSASISDCRNALEEAGGDLDKAIKLLRQRGQEIALEKKDRLAQEGRIEAYVHLGNKIGVILEVNCETDFVARSEDFRRFTRDLALQIVAQAPLYISREDIPKEEREKHREDLQEYIKNTCLLEQPFIKNPDITIKEYLEELIAKIRENIVIRRFTRYELGK